MGEFVACFITIISHFGRNHRLQSRAHEWVSYVSICTAEKVVVVLQKKNRRSQPSLEVRSNEG